MIYKLAHIKDLQKLPIAEQIVVPVVEEILAILDEEYGEERNIDENDGGCVIYASCGTKSKDLINYFDYKNKICEDIKIKNGYAVVTYLLNNEYSVTLIMHKKDLPEILRKELED